ncbi:MAG: amino acid ABC transporter ATP-binding protein [Haliea sp.]|nr:amino acid ABC transporter ATP-binding protein [Haliea sp.]
MALIEIRNLHKTFGTHHALAGINLEVEEFDLKVVMGPSGCGKSTLLRCLNRLVEPTSGDIRFRGESTLAASVDVRKLRQSIGFVFQQFALYRHLTALENVTLGLRKLRGLSKAESRDKALFELNRLDMAPHKDKYPAQLSGGQKQRVAIARALAMDPAVVLFDEPTSALDPLMVREVAELFNRLRRENVTMLCVTHDLTLARQIADSVVFLDEGVVKAESSIAHMVSEHAEVQVRNFFGGDDMAQST